MKINKRISKKRVVSLNLDEDLVKLIDKKRDGIPRSLYVNKILKKAVK